MVRLVPFLVLASLALAGCIAVPEESPGASRAERVTNSGGHMTARETREDSIAACGGGGLPLSDGAFCAERVITVTGTLEGIAGMSVSLSTFNGGVAVAQGPDGEWGFVAKLQARGATADAAKANLDNIALSWSHEAGGSHFLDVEAKSKDKLNNGYGASIAATMPGGLVLSLSAGTSNGGITIDGVITDGLTLSTSNGGISARASVTGATVSTSNGGIDAELVPTATGTLTLSTSNGGIDLVVPEGPRHGYSIEGSTSNGQVDYRMQDGEMGACPGGSQYYTPPCNHRTFETHGFSSRPIRSTLTLSTSNGNIGVSGS